ncbi:MAG: hypothetical protein K0R19_3517 [Bacillota bacterium]|nr:hypothetical protein [Bacillota bacterium]
MCCRNRNRDDIRGIRNCDDLRGIRDRDRDCDNLRGIRDRDRDRDDIRGIRDRDCFNFRHRDLCCFCIREPRSWG